MSIDDYTATQARRLLAELVTHREKLMGQLLHPRAEGNLEEKAYDQIITRLGSVQGCIAATRELLSDGGNPSLG